MLKVIALGNPLRGDDGIGLAVLERLKQESLAHRAILLDIGSDAFTLLEHLMQKDPILILDCARMGKQPGEVSKFRIDNVHLQQASDMVSLHGFSLAEIYNMAGKMGDIAECQIVGVEPKTVEFNRDISPEVIQSIPLVVETVKEEIDKYET